MSLPKMLAIPLISNILAKIFSCRVNRGCPKFGQLASPFLLVLCVTGCASSKLGGDATPLQAAVGYPLGNADMGKVKSLVEGGAEINKANKLGTALSVAEIYGNYDIVNYLIAHGAKVSPQEYKPDAIMAPAMILIPGRDYEMGQYDVTQAEWRNVMGANPSYFKNCGDNCPVEQVSWNGAQEFIQKLNASTGRHYRLPTEQEWEYSCSGGSKAEYCGSDTPDSVAWYDKNSDGTPHPVGQKQANGYGLYDMSGNVWQWMQNESGDGRALRGGSWFDFPLLVRAAYRGSSNPNYRLSNYGFRLARTIPWCPIEPGEIEHEHKK